MRPLHSDTALYRLVQDGIFHGLSVAYVDDMLRAGDQKFKDIANATSQNFKKGGNQYSPFTFTGVHVRHSASNHAKLEI